MFTALRHLQVQGTQAAFINYVVCLAVVQGIKQATQHLLPVRGCVGVGSSFHTHCRGEIDPRRPPARHCACTDTAHTRYRQAPSPLSVLTGRLGWPCRVRVAVGCMQGGLDVQIKWPNDIYYEGVKIGGALIHTTWAASTHQFCVLTGIGLNVSNSQPTTCLDDIIQSRLSQQQQQQPPQAVRVCKEQLLAGVLNHLESCFDTFQTQGFEPLRPLYLATWMHSNQVVELEEGGGAEQHQGGAGSKRVPLTIVGLSPHGFLLAQDPLGQEYELTPDGNSLDMMQGLIQKKL